MPDPDPPELKGPASFFPGRGPCLRPPGVDLADDGHMATSYTLTIDIPVANRIGGDYAFKLATDFTRRVLNRANVLTPVRTGRLRAGNQSRVQRTSTRSTGQVFNVTVYAPPVHNGSKAYTIRPKHKKALKFSYRGETVIVRSVRMPARAGRPWLTRALRETAAAEGWRIVM